MRIAPVSFAGKNERCNCTKKPSTTEDKKTAKDTCEFQNKKADSSNNSDNLTNPNEIKRMFEEYEEALNKANEIKQMLIDIHKWQGRF